MDSHLFRRFCEALLPDLPGARLEKIHQPAPGVTIFTLYGFFSGKAEKRYLALRAERQSPLLFLARNRVPVNAHPPAPVMRLRKYLSDRRVSAALCHWSERKLYLRFNGEGTPGLCLDLREGPSLFFDDIPPFSEPLWPLAPDYDGSLFSLLENDTWRQWPILTPALRRSLPYLDEPDAQALLLDLQAGGGDIFLYENDKGEREASAWPLPGAQLAKQGKAWSETILTDPLEALALSGENRVYSQLAAAARQAAGKPFSAEASRLSKLQKKLDREEERLLAMCAKQNQALLLQAQLYRFPPDLKTDRLLLEANGDEPPHELELDPRLTVRENMEALFHQAGRGKRGLEHLARRKAVVAEEKERAMQAMLRSEARLSGSALPAQSSGARPNKEAKAPGGLPKQVQAFRSSDGFIILRGRDTKGNALALKLAAPHDYWLHTFFGPSAHVIVRRDHPNQEVPQRTLEEAGALAALKSRLKDEDKAEIQYSLAKYIHPMRKAGPGMVRIDKSEGTFLAPLQPDLEEKLCLH